VYLLRTQGDFNAFAKPIGKSTKRKVPASEGKAKSSKAEKVEKTEKEGDAAAETTPEQTKSRSKRSAAGSPSAAPAAAGTEGAGRVTRARTRDLEKK
jgi:hypothetical protein